MPATPENLPAPRGGRPSRSGRPGVSSLRDAPGLRCRPARFSRSRRSSGHPILEPRVDWFALESEDAEDAIVSPAHRLAADEPLERLDSEGELAKGQGSLAP